MTDTEIAHRVAQCASLSSRLTLVPVDPARDAELIHAWAGDDRGRFWGMADHSVADVESIYRWIAAQPGYHAWLVHLASENRGDDDSTIALFQSYDPSVDPVAEAYPVQIGDIGMHLMLTPEPIGLPHATVVVGIACLSALFDDPEVLRIVAEPDADNELAITRLRTSGFTLGDVVDLRHKRAQLAFLTRERFDAVLRSGAV